MITILRRSRLLCGTPIISQASTPQFRSWPLLNFRDLTGEGQFIDVSVHEAVNTCTEIAMPTYIYNGEVVMRQTARHAMVGITQFRLSRSRDDVYMLASLSPFEREARAFTELADQVGINHILRTPEYANSKKTTVARPIPIATI